MESPNTRDLGGFVQKTRGRLGMPRIHGKGSHLNPNHGIGGSEMNCWLWNPSALQVLDDLLDDFFATLVKMHYIEQAMLKVKWLK
jgi:hypothetical protein